MDLNHLRMESSQSTDTTIDLSNGSSPLASPQSATFCSIPPTIPPTHPFRTLVLCFDGTGDQFDSDNSNIVEFFGLLKKDDPSKQMVYYQAGIGTYTIPQIATPMFAKFSKTIDMAIARDLDAHIMGGYEFLMENYAFGDRICIFGFSRGAYTARCLAGMIHKVGLLPASNNQQIPFAYKMYTRADEVGWEQSNMFKKTFSVDVDIEFLGVWDSVASVGLIPRRLPFAASNSVVCTFRHALSLDERRAKFKANQWNWPVNGEELLSITEQNLAAQAKAHKKGKPAKHGEGTLRVLELKYGKDRATPTDVDEVWFAGCHCDIGGGSVANGIKPCLARIPLRWMIRECFKTNSGIMFNAEGMKEIGLDPASLYPIVLPRPPAIAIEPSLNPKLFISKIPKKRGLPIYVHHTSEAAAEETVTTEEEAELLDSLAPVYDELKLNRPWWILEFIPLKHRYQGTNNEWKSWIGWNLGRGRHISRQSTGVKLHRSVKTRMDAEYKNGQKYWPSVKHLELKNVTWVD